MGVSGIHTGWGFRQNGGRQGNSDHSAYYSGTEVWRYNASGLLVLLPAAGLGYGTGAGGTVAQATNKGTTVVLNTVTGIITMQATALVADTTVAFTLTNSAIAATDAVLVLHESAGTIGAYSFGSTAASGSAVISVHNNTPGNLSEAIVLRFVVIKSVNA
jgi:hypothetical protein